MDSPQDLFERLLANDRRAAARVISMVENNRPGASEVVKRLHGHTGKAHIVGITGSPGTGKSTLVSCMAGKMRESGQTIGIIAIDPTSPFTGGALLGDRIRMQDLGCDPGVFIRSMGSRGAIGGLAASTNDTINILDAFGKDLVLVETVGAGQVEVDIVRYAHTSIVVTMPGSGDEIQAMKSGIMEIGDIFCVNKSDREGAARAVSEIKMMLDLSGQFRDEQWKPPIVLTVATTGGGVSELVEAVRAHQDYLRSAGLLDRKLRERARAELLEIINHRVTIAVLKAVDDGGVMSDIIERIAGTKELDPHTAAGMVIRYLLNNSAAGNGELP